MYGGNGYFFYFNRIMRLITMGPISYTLQNGMIRINVLKTKTTVS